MTEKDDWWNFKPTEGACECRICGAPADLTEVGIYVCQADSSHVADRFTGIFTELSRKTERWNFAHGGPERE